MLACLDVFYTDANAIAACVLFEHWTDRISAGERVRRFAAVAAYEPGHFYRRELPCLLGILSELPSTPEVILVDAYVWLDDEQRPGLGARLHEALGGRAAVVGVAKSLFRGAPAIPVVRGASRSPLYVSAVGMPAGEAALHVRQMHGAFRIPAFLKQVDQLCRVTQPFS